MPGKLLFFIVKRLVESDFIQIRFKFKGRWLIICREVTKKIIHLVSSKNLHRHSLDLMKLFSLDCQDEKLILGCEPLQFFWMNKYSIL